jgi:hypothetical protein
MMMETMSASGAGGVREERPLASFLRGNIAEHQNPLAKRVMKPPRLLVLESTRARLKSQLAASSREFDSILRMIWSRVEVSLDGLRRRGKR